ncbi:LysR family transcriptional regulator [Cohaesibacter sp. CAU 1516]|uniref:LysR family transcriptional regulator n=1 Tax=Cohaesibacter sp. CAU 1516 TaxID=2576038 RepID=UPI0010FDE22F|nr:LysR substrate-binding domain-containing protein [Cohaesibacter sp. CAU 1516]TLP48291.1 LysR family transcriptional regulator [Cohaesibacter sp. CAU 1516]
MDTRQLKTLVAIAAHRTFAKAAEVVGLTPSAVSQQIQALEAELDVQLFERSSRPPSLTPQGVQVLDLAKEILRLEENAVASLKGNRISGVLRLGTVRTNALNLLPEAIVKMHDQYPALKINLRVGLSSSMISDVASGRLDAALVAEHVSLPPQLRWSPFLCEPLWLIVPGSVKERDPVHILGTYPFVRYVNNVPLANLIDTEISRMGVITLDVAEIDTIGSIVSCVRQGLGVSVVPHVSLPSPDDGSLVRIPFGMPQVNRQIGIVERINAPRGDVIHRLHGLLAQLCGEHGISRNAD